MTEFETQVAQALYAARQQWRPVDMQARPDLMDWLAPRVAAAIEAAAQGAGMHGGLPAENELLGIDAALAALRGGTP